MTHRVDHRHQVDGVVAARHLLDALHDDFVIRAHHIHDDMVPVKERLIQVFHGDCAEMEGASIAQSAYLNHVPFVIIRAISDKADGSAEVDYPVFEEAAARHSARLVADLVKRI